MERISHGIRLMTGLDGGTKFGGTFSHSDVSDVSMGLK